MRKSNIIIIAILIVASIVFLALWHYLQFDLVHSLDLTLSIVWWVIIVAICFGIHRAELKRRQSIRTSFLADNLIYNSEAGIVRLEQADPASYVQALCHILDNLEYGTETSDVPNQAKIRFKYVVRSMKFKQNGNVWEGEVVDVANPSNPRSFSSAQDLAALLGGRRVA